MPICDSCGERVDDAHIRQRIERLELSTRFRPIHINVLLLDPAPPVRREDFVYDPRTPFEERSAVGQWYARELAKLAGASTDTTTEFESMLAELQHRGFFLASAIECPMSRDENLASAIRRFAATVVLRVKTSYRPKQVALLGEGTRELIEPLHAAGWSDRLILDNGVPFTIPAMLQPSAQSAQNALTPLPTLADRVLTGSTRSS